MHVVERGEDRPEGPSLDRFRELGPAPQARTQALSEISDKPFNASQAEVLAPLREPVAELGSAEVGETKAELIVEDVDASGKKRTAAALRKAAAERGFTIFEAPVVPSARRGRRAGRHRGCGDR
ncbi:hypothetical protein [Streptomyces sp. NPDC002221]|uniref:hypothetical protein n=1 Tax=Streptomyces sp. NPDC002221 TaxID=3364639 RepID=UPI0036802D64